MILLAKQECPHPSPRATARVPAGTGWRYKDGQVPSPLPQGDRKGPHPTLHRSRPYKTLLANDTKTVSGQHASCRGSGDCCNSG
jgi:hypothetical protein